MNKFYLKTLLLCLFSFIGMAQAFAHDIEVANEDGVTIYYSYINNKTELAVTHRGSYYDSYNNEYSKNVVIPESVTYGGNTYSVTSIGEYAFKACSGLTSVTIGSSVTSIGMEAFYGCSGLTSVTIPSSVTSIGRRTFYDCSGLTDLTFSDGADTLSLSTYDSYDWMDRYHLSEQPFDGCPIERAYLGRNLEYSCKYYIIDGDYGTAYLSPFRDCKSLKEVTISNSVTSIGREAFYGCNGLEKVIVPDLAAWYRISFDSNPLSYAHHLYSDENTEITDLVIPDSVTSIGNRAFSGCSGLTSVTIPNSVTSIGSYAFYGCSGLTSVTIPNSVTKIGAYAFADCSGLTSMTIGNSDESTEITDLVIPDSVTSIGAYAFSGCSGLTSVTIPNSVTSIGSSAFYGCSGLEKVIVPDLAAWCRISFDGLKSNPLYYVHHLYSDESTEITDLVIPDSVTSIGNYAFSGCSGLTSVTIPNSVTSIYSYAFYGCSGLTSVTIPNSVTSIGSYAFYGCLGLTSVTIPNSVTSIGYGALGCYNLTSIVSLIQEPSDISSGVFAYIVWNADAGGGGDYYSYYRATLYVPEGTADKYRAREGWKEFKNIVEGDPSSIAIPDNEESDATETERYDINGKRIATPQRGINVVKMSDGTVKKVLVK